MEITKSAWTYCPVVVGAVVVAEAAGDVADAVVVAMVGVSFFHFNKMVYFFEFFSLSQQKTVGFRNCCFSTTS